MHHHYFPVATPQLEIIHTGLFVGGHKLISNVFKKFWVVQLYSYFLKDVKLALVEQHGYYLGVALGFQVIHRGLPEFLLILKKLASLEIKFVQLHLVVNMY